MKTLHVHKNGQWQEVVGAPSDLQGYYTSAQTDAAILVSRNESAADLDAVQTQVIFAIEETGKQTQAKIDLKADKAETYTKTEVDGKFAPITTTTLITTQLQAVFDSIYTRPESDDRYARKQDNQQPLLAKTVTASAYGFGDTLLPAVGIGYVDTGEGYGNRLVLNIGMENEYLVYKSDLEVLNALLPRIEAIESKGAAAVSLAPYVTLETADAVYGRKDALDLLRNQVQTIFDGVYTRVEADARYAAKATTYTKTEADTKFLTLVDVNLYARQADVTASFNAFETNILKPNYALKSEVPGAGVWKAIPLRAGFTTTAARPAQYRIQFGYIELRGEVNRTGDYAVDTEYTLGDIPAADRPAQWTYGNAASYTGGNPGLPGVVHIGIKSTGEVIAVPLIRACIRLYLDNVRVSTFK
jgi:hypothetical protein